MDSDDAEDGSGAEEHSDELSDPPTEDAGAAAEEDELQTEADPEVIKQQCMELFASTDFIMEPGIVTSLRQYFSAGGNPNEVIDLLSSNYKGIAQSCNLLAEWLIQAGYDPLVVQEWIEKHLMDVIIKHFDPKKADSIFKVGGTPSWLTQMIQSSMWRSLIYKLAEAYPDCVMLSFTVKLISDEGFEGEITSVSTASQQIAVFSRVLKTAISKFVVADSGEEALTKVLPEITEMVCFGEHTYLYSQALLHILSQESKGGAIIKRLSQEILKSAKGGNRDVTPITMALSGASAHPRACQAISAMLSKGALNPADITVLYKMYTSPDQPPVELIRAPHFLDIFIDALFKPGSKINPEHKPKYLYILAYAASVQESVRRTSRKPVIVKDELKVTQQAIEKMHVFCTDNKSSAELIAEINTIYQCVRFPVVATGVLKWIEYVVFEPSYFRLNTDSTPVHLALLDEISTCHKLLHRQVMCLLVRLFESPLENLDNLVQLDLKRTFLDRMVHLISLGHVLPVVSYIRECSEKQDSETDISLIRYFVTEVLEIILPPYSGEFAASFLPLIDNDNITGSLRNSRSNPSSHLVEDFIKYCRHHFPDCF